MVGFKICKNKLYHKKEMINVPADKAMIGLSFILEIKFYKEKIYVEILLATGFTSS